MPPSAVFRPNGLTVAQTVTQRSQQYAASSTLVVSAGGCRTGIVSSDGPTPMARIRLSADSTAHVLCSFTAAFNNSVGERSGITPFGRMQINLTYSGSDDMLLQYTPTYAAQAVGADESHMPTVTWAYALGSSPGSPYADTLDIQCVPDFRGLTDWSVDVVLHVDVDPGSAQTAVAAYAFTLSIPVSA